MRSDNYVPHADAGSEIASGPRWDDVDDDTVSRPDYDTRSDLEWAATGMGDPDRHNVQRGSW